MSKRKSRGPGKGNSEVGHSKPPKEYQFKPGQSGNPKGRPKGAKSLATDLSEELKETVTAREFGAQKKLTKQRAILKAQIAKAIAGDTRAAEAVFRMARELLPDDFVSDANTPTSAEDAMILAMLFAEHGVELRMEE
jgi:hypothetical protein